MSMKRQLVSLIPASLRRLIPKRLKEKFRANGWGKRDVCIDIVGSCNLGCFSCPSGRNDDPNKGGKMRFETFKAIISKVALDYPGTTISLFNWTEPLLHPEVLRFLEEIPRHGLKSRISTNLNLLPDAEGLAKVAPDGITISLSGFTQSVYEIGHGDGNIEVVKANMKLLSEAMQRTGKGLAVTVYYHKYFHNLHEEKLMKDFSKSLGFGFGSGWAYYMPVEKVMDYVDRNVSKEQKEKIESKFPLNIADAIDATKPFRKQPCHLATSTLTMDCRGNVQLCCAVYDQKQFTVANYLEMPLPDIEEKIKTHEYCTKCMDNGLHMYASWHNFPSLAVEYEKIASKQVAMINSNR